MANNLERVGSLWVGNELSNLEILSIRSFILNNHPYHLYVYNDIKNLPEGVTLEDANKIVPEKDIFRAPGSNGRPGSLGAFSDYFRFFLIISFMVFEKLNELELWVISFACITLNFL